MLKFKIISSWWAAISLLCLLSNFFLWIVTLYHWETGTILLETIYLGGRGNEGRKYIVNKKPQMLKLTAPSNKCPVWISVSTGRQSGGGGGGGTYHTHHGKIISNSWMRLSRIWRIKQIKGVIDQGRRLRWITPSEICLILYILQKPNSLIALLFIQNNSYFKNITSTCLPASMLSSSLIVYVQVCPSPQIFSK